MATTEQVSRVVRNALAIVAVHIRIAESIVENTVPQSTLSGWTSDRGPIQHFAIREHSRVRHRMWSGKTQLPTSVHGWVKVLLLLSRFWPIGDVRPLKQRRKLSKTETGIGFVWSEQRET